MYFICLMLCNLFVELKTVLYVKCDFYVLCKHTTKKILICIKCSILFQTKCMVISLYYQHDQQYFLIAMISFSSSFFHINIKLRSLYIHGDIFPFFILFVVYISYRS